MKKTIFTLLSLSLLSIGINAQTTKWNLDKAHSHIGFSVDHMVISETQGKFTDYTANLQSDKADFSDAKFDATINVKSVNTENEKRDEHLKGADFFDEAKFPTIYFKGISLQKTAEGKYKATGDLTIKGVTKRIELEAKGGIIKDPWGKTRAGFKLSGEINRQDFGLNYNSVIEAGGLAVGKEVRIAIAVEFVK